MASPQTALLALCSVLAFQFPHTGLDDLPPMKSQLSTRPTQDITVTCHLAAFMDTHRSFHPNLLQVVQESIGQQKWATLATLDLANGKVSPSDHLRQSADNFYVVNGTKDGKVIRNSWLRISFANVHTSLSCQVSYSDSGSPKTWLSKAFPFHSNSETYPGITVTVTKGLSIQCLYKPQAATVNGTFFEIVGINTDRDLCQQQEKWDEQHLQRLCSFRNGFVGGMAIKEAHIFNTSQDEGTCYYQCRISGVEMDQTEICQQGSSATCHPWWYNLCSFGFGVLLSILIYLLQRWMHRSGKQQSEQLSRLLETLNLPPSQSQEYLGLSSRVDGSSSLASPLDCADSQRSFSLTEHPSAWPPWLSISPPNLPRL